MERQYTRLDEVRRLLDEIIHAIPDPESKRCAFVHLYGTGLLAAAFALKRGCTREVAELAEITGMLHDLLCYVDPEKDTLEHAHTCADYAKEQVLSKLSCFSEAEKEQIYQGIYHHSDKKETGTVFEELIKDADAAHHALRNPMEDFFFTRPRIRRPVEELCGNQTSKTNPSDPMNETIPTQEVLQ